MESLKRKQNCRRRVFKRKLMYNEYNSQNWRPAVMPQEQYDTSKEAFLNYLQDQVKNRHDVERNTILQAQSALWLNLRKLLLTASWFSKVCKRRATTNPAALIKSILYPSPMIDYVPSVWHGKVNEKLAIKQLEIQERISIEKCGLFVDEELYFLGASPDGLIEDGVVEIKCPSSAFGMAADDAIARRKITFWKVDGTVNRRHDWFYQIQGQLHLAQRNYCLFAVWTGRMFKMKTEIVFRDHLFWEERMKDKLVDFYHTCLVPEMVKLNPRESTTIKFRNGWMD